MIEGWTISKLLESYDDSKKEELKEWFGESLYDKLTSWEDVESLDDSEKDEVRDFFMYMIAHDYFDHTLQDPYIHDVGEGGVYYQFRVGLSIEKLDIHFIYCYDDYSYQEFDSLSEMEKEFRIE
jgi:hypothetical protein